MMNHNANSMSTSTIEANGMQFIDLGASNNVTSHNEWSGKLQNFQLCHNVETNDVIAYFIHCVDDIPFDDNEECQKCIKYVLHAPTFTKTVVLTINIMEQVMLVQLNNCKLFIKYLKDNH